MLQWPYGGVLAAYSCGGSRGIGKIPHRVPFYVPRNAGTDDGATIARFSPAASGAWAGVAFSALTKVGASPFSGLIDGLSR